MKDFKKRLTEAFPKLEIHARTAAKKYSMEYSDLMQETVIRGLEKQHLFDGKNIEQRVDSLGYVLMDEASGNFFGKQLIRSYYFNEMPNNLAKE